MTVRRAWFFSFLLALSSCLSPPIESSVSLNGSLYSSQSDSIRIITGEIRFRMTEAPAKGVRVGWAGTNLHTRTDADGRFSLRERIGFGWLTMSGKEILSTRWRPQAVMHVWPIESNETDQRRYLMARPVMDGDPLDDPDLTERARAILRGGDFFSSELPALERGPFRLKQSVRPPETIRVYRRGPEDNSCEGRVDVMALEEYVRGVLPHEWIPSWHEESLRAGAIAARSYAWGWILAGGKLDCADLDDTTRSQVYEDTRNDRADGAVMSTTGIGIYDPNRNQVVTSEYSAENADPTDFGVCEPLCTGETLFGHGRGMCQWGTSRWASRNITQTQADVISNCAVTSPTPIVGTGQIAEWMVSHYFPGKYTTALEDGGAALQLSQSIERLGVFSCALPDRGLGCPDFVPEGQSEGIFDTFVGQRFDLVYWLENTGASEAIEVVWILDLPQGVEVQPMSVDGQIRVENGRLTVTFPRLAPDARGAVELRVELQTTGRKEFRPFVAEIQNQYDKRGWGLPPTLNVNQTFNDGELRQLTEIDVFDPKTWDFRREPALNPVGWHGEQVTFETVDGGLRVSSANDDEVSIESPHLFGNRSGADVVLMRSDAPVTLEVRYDGQAVFETLGTATGTRVFPILPDAQVFQLRLRGASPFTVESVSLRSRLEGEGGEAGDPGPGGLLDSGNSPTDSLPVDGAVMTVLPGQAGAAGTLQGGGVRGSGSCGQQIGGAPHAWWLWTLMIVMGIRRRVNWGYPSSSIHCSTSDS